MIMMINWKYVHMNQGHKRFNIEDHKINKESLND